MTTSHQFTSRHVPTVPSAIRAFKIAERPLISVVIREAHPSDGFALPEHFNPPKYQLPQCTSIKQRAERAVKCRQILTPLGSHPFENYEDVIVDGMDNILRSEV